MQNQTDNIKKAVDIINSGGIIAIPTDTIYGLSASIHNLNAIKRIFDIKGRDSQKPLIIHISDIKELYDIAYVDNRVENLAKNFWPGALTLILKRKLFSPEMNLIRNNLPTITVRIPNHNIPLEIIKKTGPIISTSANLSNHPSATTADEVKRQLQNKVDLIIDGGASPIGEASTILDLSEQTPELIRQGSIPFETLKNFC